jgi:hypothetical protein
MRTPPRNLTPELAGADSVTEPSQQDAYNRGVAAGEIAQRLAEHDSHLGRINGSMEKVAVALGEVKLELQRQGDRSVAAIQQLRDQRTADAATVVTTAAALESERQARTDQSTASWTPMQRLLAVVAGLVGIAVLAVAIYAAARPH